MAFSVKEWMIGGKNFCFCLPSRAGVVIMSFLSLLLSALLAIIIWFEVSSTKTLSSKEKAAFVVAGLMETFLLVASILGFAGAIARKYLFVTIYAYFIYVHFFLNVGIATYFLYVIVSGSDTAIVKACQQGLKNTDSQDQCEGLFKVTKKAYLVVASLILLIEMYGAIVVTRYMRQLRNEKRHAKARNSGKTRALQRHSAHPSEDIGLLVHPVHAPASEQFDPYAGYSDSTTPTPRSREIPMQNMEEGYGGGRWTYQEIHDEEKRAHRSSLSTVEEDITAEGSSLSERMSTLPLHPPYLPPLSMATTHTYTDEATMKSEPPSYSATPTSTEFRQSHQLRR